jgi:apolipoprotein N-acyltransferase
VLRLLAAAVGGATTVGAFPPRLWWPLGVLGTALVVAAARGARVRVAALVGFVAGLAFFVPLLVWLTPIGVDAWLLLAVSQALWFVPLAIGLAWVQRLPGWPIWAAGLWLAEEYARGHWPFGGFTYGRLAFAQPDSPFTAYAAIGGAPLVSFAVALSGALLVALSVAAVRRRWAAAGFVAAAATLVGTAALAVPVPTSGQRSPSGPAQARVAVIQGNVPRLGLDAFTQAGAVLRHHATQTERFAAAVNAGNKPAPDFVVWPENASDFDPFRDPAARRTISRAVRSVGVPVLVGAVLQGPGKHLRNTGIAWDPRAGPGKIYVKQHLVPFGEYIPFRSLLTKLISRFQRVPDDFAPGHRPGVLTLGPARLGDVICFEIGYDSIAREAVTHGGRLIVEQTNDASYEHPGDSGRGGETAQQLAMARLRAAEHGRGVVVAATSGVSAVIRPDGSLARRSGVFAPAVFDVRVPLRDTLTVADRVGPAPEWALAAIGVLAALLGLGRGCDFRPRRRGEARPLRPTADVRQVSWRS